MPKTQVSVAKSGEQYCHEMLRKLAYEMCMELYESLAHDNAFYKAYPTAESFADSAWGFHLEEARHTLGKLLATPIPEEMKEKISCALIEDEPYRHRRLSAEGLRPLMTYRH